MFEWIGPEFQCLKKQGQNSNVLKDRSGTPMIERIGPEYQRLKGKCRNTKVLKEQGQNTNV